MTTNPIIQKLIESLEAVEKFPADHWEFKLEINSASFDEEDEDDDYEDVPELSDYECVSEIELRTESEDLDRWFEPHHFRELLELLKSAEAKG